MTPADSLACALDSLAESLKHAKHVAALDPIRNEAKAVLAQFFKRQKNLTVRQFTMELHTLGLVRVAEAASDEAKTAVLAAIPDGATLPNAVTKGLAVDYSTAMEAALAAGYDTLAGDLAVAERSISADVTAAYLRERSLEALAAQIEPTTVARIQTALADAYESGADYDGLVSAVTAEFDDMAEDRAGVIAQTAMNGAYNAGRVQLGKDIGFDEKSWSPDGTNACDECMANTDEWIPIDEAFASGDDFPPLHPNCDCSVDIRASSSALAA